MSTTKKTRRTILKQTAATGAALAATRMQAAAASSLPELLRTDVLVVGGGPAGLGAALAAARTGAETLLVETHAFFGGVAAWSLGMPINQMRPGGEARGKLHELLITKLEAYGPQAISIGQHQLWCNVEYLKVAALDALDEVGCRYLVHLRAVDAIMENGRAAGVVVSTKNGLAAIRAKAVVDCTGDADIAHYAGAATMKETGNLSPSTLALGLTNATAEQIKSVKIAEVSGQARSKYPLIPKNWNLHPVSNSKACYYINHAGTRDLGQFDTTDPFQRSEAECKSRRQALQMTLAMREFSGDALANIELCATGPQIGVRETRRVKGEYVLTEEDAMEGRAFDDVIAWRSGYLDIGFVRLEAMKIHDVPYRSIVPAKVDGLLTAGRSISATHVAASAGKSMGNCVATGHAAGLAAAMCAKQGIQPREVKVARLQDALRADGVDLAKGGSKQTGVTHERGVS